ncbi:MAG: hypothetical protein AB8B54_06675 [Sphingorhabdus sp.]
MKRIQLAVSILLAGTAMSAQARETSIKQTAIPISALSEEDFEGNLERIEDINRLCVINRGDPAFGRNATPGVISPMNVRGLKDEYRGRFDQIPQHFADGIPWITPNGERLTASDLQRIEILQAPDALNCNADTSTATPDPDLAVQALPDQVYNARRLPRASDVRADLDSLVEACRTATSEEDAAAYRQRYENHFAQLRELDAIRRDLRERLLTNDPDLDEADAINQLKKLDPAIEGAIFPSQLKCPPTASELAMIEREPKPTGNEYSIKDATTYREKLALDDSGQPVNTSAEYEVRGPFRSDNTVKIPATETSTPNPDLVVESNMGAYVSAGFGSLTFGDATVGTGFQSTGPGTETFADTAPTQFDSSGISAGIHFELTDALKGGFHYGYSEGDARKDFDIPAGGAIDVGNVYGGLSPSGSTGLNIGNRGLSGFNEADFNLHEVKFSVTTSIATEGGFASTATLFINALFMDRSFRGETNANVFGTPITQGRDQTVQDRLFGLGGILNGRLPVAEGVSATGSVAGGLYYRETDMEATEWNMCALCPPADQNFTLTFAEDDSGTSFAGTVAAGLEFDVSRDLKFTIGADASYVSDIGQIINPSSGDQVLNGETTRLGTTDAWRWQATAGFKLSF